MSSSTSPKDSGPSEDLMGTKLEQNEESTVTLPPEKPPKKRQAWHQIDGSYAWVQVLAAGIIFFVLAGISRSFSLIYQRLLEKYQRSDSVTSWVPSLHGTIKMCSSPLIGFLIRRYTERTVCFLGSVIGAVSLILTALSPSIECVYLFYGLFYGVAMNTGIVTGITMVAKYFNKKRGRAMGVAFAFVPVGSLVMSPLIQYLFKEYDYFGAMLILSSVALHTSISAMLMRPLPSQKMDSSKGPDDAAEDEEDVEVKIVTKEDEEMGSSQFRQRANTQGSVIPVAIEGSVLDLRTDDSAQLPSCRLTRNMSDTEFESIAANESNKSKKTKKRCVKVIKSILNNLGFNLLKNPTFAMFCGFMASFIMCLDMTMSFLASIIKEKGFSDVEVLVALIVFSSVDVPSRLLSGCLFDHRTVRNNKVTVSALIFFMMGLFLLLFPFALGFNYILGLVCLSLSSCCRATVHSQHATVITELVGMGQMEAGISINRFFQGIGLLISSPLCGFLKDKTGTYSTGYILMASFQMLVTGTFFVGKAVNRCSKR